jgi:hypothetical protein
MVAAVPQGHGIIAGILRDIDHNNKINNAARLDRGRANAPSQTVIDCLTQTQNADPANCRIGAQLLSFYFPTTPFEGLCQHLF